MRSQNAGIPYIFAAAIMLSINAFGSGVPCDATDAVAPAAAPQSMLTRAAVNAAPTIAGSDPFAARLLSLSANDWNSVQQQVYLNTGHGFVTVGGATLPVPETGSESILSEYGCTHVFVRNFDRPQRSVQVAVYSFLNPNGAYGAYTTMRRGSQTVVVRGDASSEDDRSVSFWEGRRFVVISTPKDDDDVSKTLVSQLADKVAVAINEHADMPPLLLSLPYLDRIKGSERFFLGPQAARRYITLPHFNSLYSDTATSQALAEYSWMSPFSERMKTLVLEYPNADLTRRAFASYSAAVAEDHKTWSLEPSAQLCKINGNFSWCGARGTHLYIILGARHKESALLLARQMAY